MSAGILNEFRTIGTGILNEFRTIGTGVLNEFRAMGTGVLNEFRTMRGEIILLVLLLIFYLLFNSYKNSGDNPLVRGYGCCKNACMKVYNNYPGTHYYDYKSSNFRGNENYLNNRHSNYHIDDDELNDYSNFCNNVHYDGSHKAYYVTDKDFEQSSQNSEYTSLANFSTDQVKTTFKLA